MTTGITRGGKTLSMVAALLAALAIAAGGMLVGAYNAAPIVALFDIEPKEGAAPSGETAPPASAVADIEEAQLQAIVDAAVRERPELVRDAIKKLHSSAKPSERKSFRVALAERRGDLERDPNAPVLGNPLGDVTIVEFFDYNCPYCKAGAKQLRQLVTEDDGVRIVFHEWPVIDQGSLIASRAALAARKQGKYEAMHWRLMALPRATEASVMRAAESIGLDMDQLRQDMNAPEVFDHIANSTRLMNELGVTGTPFFIIGDAIAPGLISLPQMQHYVRQARAAASSN